MGPAPTTNPLSALLGLGRRGPGAGPSQGPGVLPPEVASQLASAGNSTRPPGPMARGRSPLRQAPPGRFNLIAEILRGGGTTPGPTGAAGPMSTGLGRMTEREPAPAFPEPGQTDQGPSINEPSLADAGAQLGAAGEPTGSFDVWSSALNHPDLLAKASEGGMTSLELLQELLRRRDGNGVPRPTPGTPGLM